MDIRKKMLLEIGRVWDREIDIDQAVEEIMDAIGSGAEPVGENDFVMTSQGIARVLDLNSQRLGVKMWRVQLLERIERSFCVFPENELTKLYTHPAPTAQDSEHWAVKNPGAADQYKLEAMAARACLGLSSEADDVSPADIRLKISALTAQDSKVLEVVKAANELICWVGCDGEIDSDHKSVARLQYALMDYEDAASMIAERYP